METGTETQMEVGTETETDTQTGDDDDDLGFRAPQQSCYMAPMTDRQGQGQGQQTETGTETETEAETDRDGDADGDGALTDCLGSVLLLDDGAQVRPAAGRRLGRAAQLVGRVT